MNRSFTSVACTLIMNAVFLTSVGFADITNGSFENDFNSWTAVGFNSIETAAFGVTPTDLAKQALVRTANGEGGGANLSRTVAQLNTDLGLTTTSIASVNANAFNGSAFYQSNIVVNANDKLTFDWDFITTEATPSAGNNDFAFWTFARTSGGPVEDFVQLIADTNTSGFMPFLGGPTEHTGYRTLEHVFANGGTYRIGFGIANASDNLGRSTLLIDRVSIAVPEPGSFAAIGLACVGIAIRRRRIR